jgi:hypothetical protein
VAEPPPQVVATDGGVVTLVGLDVLRLRAASLQGQIDALTAQGRSLRSLAEELWGRRGSVLLDRAADWAAAPPIADLIVQAKALGEREAADDAKLQSIHDMDHTGVGGLISRVGEWSETRKASADRAGVDAQLHPLLVQIGRQAPEVTVPDADAVRVEAVSADAQAQQIESEAAEAVAAANLTKDEVKRRTDAEHEMGFDAPYLAASLQAEGVPHIQSPLILKKGEQASIAVAATLARQQTHRQWVGGSQGFSFPIGHTGIRYRVGSFRGHPVEQQSLGRLDTGTLVITNQRLAFIGSVKSTSVAFAKLLHVECYSDALAVFLEGREVPDFYYVAQPKYVLFFINWFLKETP